jgi:hypothetical protein
VDEKKKMAGTGPRSIPAITAATKRNRHDWSARMKNSSAVRFIAPLYCRYFAFSFVFPLILRAFCRRISKFVEGFRC